MAKSYLQEDSGEGIEELKDEEILRMAQKEPAVFEILVEKYQEPLMRAAWRVVRGREEAEDIVQEAFVKMYKNADKFEKLEGIEFKSWAYKVTINTAITHYRKLKRGEFLVEDPALFQDIGDTEPADTRLSFAVDAKAVVASVLNKMPEHLRTVLASYYLQDKSYKTIAQEEKISIPTLKMRLFRAKKLFKRLKDNPN
ncbi:MAG: RNA polymerase sigma factor [Candidatus Sungiibacteriota bacterium]|uniref:RNA polymerase sigma factor n=1 Tax=Candidatus Sungiibacteriota bacterium TaxID=2750080 RepID=A0A7T5UQX4_9BACT|nr:MAG: RNA polymerase sigma factor [Candidatus Sungbacteria bacterium]